MPHNVDLIWRIFDELQQLAGVVGLEITDGFDVREQIVIIGFQKFLIFVIKFVAISENHGIWVFQTSVDMIDGRFERAAQ